MRPRLDLIENRQGRGDVGPLGRVVDAGIAMVVMFGTFVTVSRLLGWVVHPVVVLWQAALPVLLLPVWLVLPVAGVRRLPVRAVAALLLCTFHVFALYPAMGTRRLPVWAGTAPTMKVVSANVSNLNRDPGMAAALLAPGGDVYVLVEVSAVVRADLVDRGLFAALPYVAESGDIGADSVLIASKYPLTDVVAQRIGGVPVVSATVVSATVVTDAQAPLSGRSLRVVAAHPAAPTSSARLKGFRAWMRWAREQARVTTGPLIMAGDFNSSRFVPAMGELLAAGMTDAHESRGRGLTTSWPVGDSFLGPAFLRLDHILVRGAVVTRSVSDLTVPGSDHRAIVAVVALH